MQSSPSRPCSAVRKLGSKEAAAAASGSVNFQGLNERDLAALILKRRCLWVQCTRGLLLRRRRLFMQPREKRRWVAAPSGQGTFLPFPSHRKREGQRVCCMLPSSLAAFSRDGSGVSFQSEGKRAAAVDRAFVFWWGRARFAAIPGGCGT